MAHKIEFLKSTTINGIKYNVGQKLQVSASIYNRLLKAELAQDVKTAVAKSKDEVKVETKEVETKSDTKKDK